MKLKLKVIYPLAYRNYLLDQNKNNKKGKLGIM